MFSFLFALPVFVCLCVARPQEAAAPPAAAAAAAAPRGGENPPIPIVSQTDETNPDGSFQFSFETGNGIKIEQKGYLKDGANASEKIQVIEGSASYTDSEGNPVSLRFIADENGYQPEGDHIPKAPGSQEPGQGPSPAGAQPAQARAQPAPVAAQPAPTAPQPAPAGTQPAEEGA